MAVKPRRLQQVARGIYASKLILAFDQVSRPVNSKMKRRRPRSSWPISCYIVCASDLGPDDHDNMFGWCITSPCPSCARLNIVRDGRGEDTQSEIGKPRRLRRGASGWSELVDLSGREGILAD